MSIRVLSPVARHPRNLRYLQCPIQRASYPRSYHSYDHPTAPPYPPTESAILSAALSHVPEHGFTNTSLTIGAQEAGFLPISTNLFPRGVFELVLFYLVQRRLALKNAVNGEDETGGLRQIWDERKIGVGGRVRGLVLERLKMNSRAGVVERWQEALAIMAQPSYVPPSTSELWRLADEIWFLAGDTSVDTSWYTKRASLSAIYAAAEVFQTQDTSPDFKDTERFIDSRLDDLRRVGGTVGAVGEWLGYTGHSVVNVLRSKGMKI